MLYFRPKYALNHRGCFELNQGSCRIGRVAGYFGAQLKVAAGMPGTMLSSFTKGGDPARCRLGHTIMREESLKSAAVISRSRLPGRFAVGSGYTSNLAPRTGVLPSLGPSLSASRSARIWVGASIYFAWPFHSGDTWLTSSSHTRAKTGILCSSCTRPWPSSSATPGLTGRIFR